MKTPAESYFESVKTEADIDGLIQSQVEDLYVDFKTKSDHSTAVVDKDLQAVLSKAISGFANADGGLIVLGVDAPQGRLPQKKPISPLVQFDQEVNTYAPRATSFGVEGVRTKRVDLSGGGGGFLLVLVPKSDQAPHRSMKDHRYYQRIGDSFMPMEHYQLADMFGRRHQPKLVPYVRFSGDINFRSKISGVLGVRNVGRAIAKYPSVSILSMPDFEADQWGLSGNGHFGLPPIQGATSFREYRGGVDHVIHPGVAFDITKLNASFPHTNYVLPAGFERVTLAGTLVADAFPVKEWSVSLAREEIEGLLRNPHSRVVLDATLAG